MRSWQRQKTDEEVTEQSATEPLSTKGFVEEQSQIVPVADKSDKLVVPGQAIPLLGERELFMEWLATVRSERQPATQGELARLLGVHVTTLSRWKHEPGFIRELIRRVRTKYADRLPGIISAVAARGEMGDVPAGRLFLDFLGMSKRLEIEGEVHQTITLEQALKENGENLEPPSWVNPYWWMTEGAPQDGDRAGTVVEQPIENTLDITEKQD
jgi:hypothetical protein